MSRQMSEKKRRVKNGEETEKKAVPQSKCNEMRTFLEGELSLGSQEDSELHLTLCIQLGYFKTKN